MAPPPQIARGNLSHPSIGGTREMLTELRRELHREAETVQAKSVLKGTRWLLLKRADNLDKARGEPDRWREALKLNQSLAVAYYLKDDLNRFWQQPHKAIAAQWLTDWLHDAETSGIRLLQKFAKTLASHRQSLLAWYDYPISTGPLEAVNNKIRLLHRQAYGYRNSDFFRRVALAACPPVRVGRTATTVHSFEFSDLVA